MSCLFKKRSTRWIDKATGRRVSPTLAKGPNGKPLPGFRKVSEKSKNYWAKFTAGGMTYEQSLDSTDKQAAQRELADLIRAKERRAAGIEDNYTDAAVQPIGEHVDAWLADMANAGVSARRRADVERRVRKLIDLAGCKRLTDMSPERLQAALAKLTRRAVGGGQVPVSIQTRNEYIQHVKQFAIWCVPDRLPTNPLAKLKGANVATDRRHDRRELSADEQVKLIGTTEASPVIRFNLDGPSRAMLYDLAFGTGLRRGELQSLTPDSFDLDAGTVTVSASYSKHRRQDVQSLPPALVDRLREWFAAGKPLWPDLTKYTGRMFRADLEAAGVPYVVPGPDGPLFADFHCTRHTFISDVCRTDATPKEAMEMARHSDPRLTFKRYAKIRLHDKAKIAAQLPDRRVNAPSVAAPLAALNLVSA